MCCSEKKALFDRLRDAEDSNTAQRLRQIEMLRLRREAMLVHQEDGLTAAALVFRFNAQVEQNIACKGGAKHNASHTIDRLASVFLLLLCVYFSGR
jgi:hypothetical protein